jgi:hypothetical protein
MVGMRAIAQSAAATTSTPLGYSPASSANMSLASTSSSSFADGPQFIVRLTALFQNKNHINKQPHCNDFFRLISFFVHRTA